MYSTRCGFGVRYFQLSEYNTYTVFRKKTPTHIFFNISMNDVWI